METIWTWAFHFQVVGGVLIIKSNCISYRSILIVYYSIEMAYYTTLPSWDKAHLYMMYTSFYMLIDSVC